MRNAFARRAHVKTKLLRIARWHAFGILIWRWHVSLAREETVPNICYLAHSAFSYLRGLCQVSFVGKKGGRRSLTSVVLR